MQGIDISNYQNGMNLGAVPHDFALVLATYGTSFVDHSCNGFVSALKAENKPWGVYHYCTGAEGEADYFINNVRGYIHQGILALDWESGGNKQWGMPAFETRTDSPGETPEGPQDPCQHWRGILRFRP